MSDLDPAAIMAEHQGWKQAEGTYCTRCYSMPWPCLPYRLAADLSEANRKLAEVEGVVERGGCAMMSEPVKKKKTTTELVLDSIVSVHARNAAGKCRGCPGGYVLYPCNVLTEALWGDQRLRAKLADVWDECVAWFGAGHAMPEWRVNMNVLLAAEEANPYRAALGADHE